MAPLADAMGLVDGDQGDGMAGQPLQHGALHQPLGGQIEQIELARLHPAPDGRALVEARIGVQAGGGHARLFQPCHLVGHQGDQRRDDQSHARAHHGRDLVADAFAPAGGQHGQGVAPGQHLANHLRLQAAKVGVAEGVAQNLARAVQAGGGRGVRFGELEGIGDHAPRMRHRGQVREGSESNALGEFTLKVMASSFATTVDQLKVRLWRPRSGGPWGRP